MSSVITLLEEALSYNEIITDYFFPWKFLLEELKLIRDKTCYEDLTNETPDDKELQQAYNTIFEKCFSETAPKGRGVCTNHVYFAVINFFKNLKNARAIVAHFCELDLEEKMSPLEVNNLNNQFELLRLFALRSLHLMDCTVERQDKQEDHYSLCFVSPSDEIVYIMDVSLKKSFEVKKTTISNFSSTDKKKNKLHAILNH